MAKTLIGSLQQRDRTRLYTALRYFEVGLERRIGKPLHSRLPYAVEVRKVPGGYRVVCYASGTTSHAWFDIIPNKEEAMEYGRTIHAAAAEYFSRKLKLCLDQLGNLLDKEVRCYERT